MRDFDVAAYVPPKERRRLDRSSQLGVAAAADALADAGDVGADPARCGVVMGGGVGGLTTLEEQVIIRHEKGSTRVSPFLVPMMMVNATAGTIAMRFGWTGPNLCVATACAASANAIGEAARLIRYGEADVVLAGGAECSITPTAMGAFSRMTALSTRNDDPAHASRPFDADRDGFVMGEGAAALVLESWDRAVARGAHLRRGRRLRPQRRRVPHHRAVARRRRCAACMQLALDDAGLAPGRHRARERARHVDTVERRRRGRGHPQGVRRHSPAHDVDQGRHRPPHRRGRRDRGRGVPARHRNGVVPPTANLEHMGDDIRLDIVAGSPRAVAAGAGAVELVRVRGPQREPDPHPRVLSGRDAEGNDDKKERHAS